jgi:hypothetical protein
MELICRVIGHCRSKKLAVRKPDAWHSLCVFCRAHMVRTSPGNWRLVDAAADGAEASPPHAG